MKSAFRKISRVRNLGGFTRWYLSEDCLLAAKQVMYTVEYRRFYLRDLESVVVWPSRLWFLRLTVPTLLLAVIGIMFGNWVNLTLGAVFVGLGIFWLFLEVALGPTAKSCVRSTGTSVDLPLVARTRRAKKVLAKIDAAVRGARSTDASGVGSQPAVTSVTATATATERHGS